jgi:integrase
MSVEALNRLFASPVSTHGLRSRCGEATFWMPVLGLFTGGRYANLRHLRVSDVHQHDGVWSVLMPDTLATRPPRGPGWVSLPQTLLEVGWLEYVERCRQRGEAAWLFPELFASTDGLGHPDFRFWFKRHLRHMGLDHARLGFASLRYTFAAFARQSGIRERVIWEILGGPLGIEPGQPEAGDTRPRFKRFVEAMNRLALPGLELSHLMRQGRKVASSSVQGAS